MHELIWFSIPGAIVIVSTFGLSSQTAATVFAWPLAGFILNQFVRLIFESRPVGGYSIAGRKVIDAIADANGLDKQKSADREKAFLIYEITFYGSAYPPAFREHIRNMWHYVLSFWTCAVAAGIGIIGSWLGSTFGNGTVCEPGIVSIIDVLLILLFTFKARLTRLALFAQEIHHFNEDPSIFIPRQILR